MRILLFTGKGGVGKTTVAAATAVARRRGRAAHDRVLDRSRALARRRVRRRRSATSRRRSRDRLWGQQLDARVRFEEAWDDVRTYLVDLLDWAGADAVEAEELAVIPGLDEVFALADIKEFATSGDYDLVVVDCAPTAETIRLLSLPDVLGWYMDRMFDDAAPADAARRGRSCSAMSGMPIAGDQVFGAVRRFYDRLDGVRELLTDGDDHERAARRESRAARRRRSAPHVHVPLAVRLPRRRGDREPHAARRRSTIPWLDAVEGDAGRAPRRDRRRVRAAADAHGRARRTKRSSASAQLSMFAKSLLRRRRRRGPALVRRAVPRRRRRRRARAVGAAAVHRRATTCSSAAPNDELVVTVGPHRRALVLPDSLVRREVGGAHFVDDRLVVEFV